MNLITARPLILIALLLALSGCDKKEPTSYLIPKESREVTMPGAVDPAKQAPAAAATASAPVAGPMSGTQGPIQGPIQDAAPGSTAPGGMRVLPGMQEAADQAGEVTYTVPSGWEELAPSGIRKANLKVSDPNGSAELTVLVFPGDVGGRLANINRWRGQIGLEASTPEDLPQFTETYTISNHRGLYVRLEGGAQSILGGLLPFHGSTWFFKFQGSSGTVLANEAKMKAFLNSVAIEDIHH